MTTDTPSEAIVGKLLAQEKYLREWWEMRETEARKSRARAKENAGLAAVARAELDEWRSYLTAQRITVPVEF